MAVGALARPARLASAEVKKKPNILFFFVDDQGWQDTSEPFWTQRTGLNDTYRTPNMEKLAREGMKFTQAYACAVCSPSRVSLMTGMNAARHKVTNWTLHKDWSPDEEHPTLRLPEWNCNGLSRRRGVNRTVVAETLPELLRRAGYKTIQVGKAHFAADGTPSEDPCELGFDVNIAGHCAGAPGSYRGTRHFARNALQRGSADRQFLRQTACGAERFGRRDPVSDRRRQVVRVDSEREVGVTDGQEVASR